MAAQHEPAASITCGICHNDRLQSVGELDCCFHRFCFPCILQWSQIESRCPFCKARFRRIKHRRLSAAAREAPDPGQANLDGRALEVVDVLERDQGAEEPDPMAGVLCMHCGSGEDDNLLLLCDGCDGAMHTFCAGLMAVPEGEWFCPECAEAQLAPPLGGPVAHGAGPAVLDLSDGDEDPAYGPAAASRMPDSAATAASGGRRDGRRRGSPVSAHAQSGSAGAASAAAHPLEDWGGAGSEEDDVLLVPQRQPFSSAQPSAGRSASRSRRRLIRGSERTVGGARGAVADMLRRVGSAAAAADNLPSNAHRQVQAMRDTFEARRQAAAAEEEAAARRAAAAATPAAPSSAERFGGGNTPSRASGGAIGGSGDDRSVSAVFRQELAEASAAAAVRNAASPNFKRPAARRPAPQLMLKAGSQPAMRQSASSAASPPRSLRLGSPPRSPVPLSQRHADGRGSSGSQSRGLPGSSGAARHSDSRQSRWEAQPSPPPSMPNGHAQQPVALGSQLVNHVVQQQDSQPKPPPAGSQQQAPPPATPHLPQQPQQTAAFGVPPPSAPPPLPPPAETAAGGAASEQQPQQQPQQPRRQRRPWPSIAERRDSPAGASPGSLAGSPGASQPWAAAASPAAGGAAGGCPAAASLEAAAPMQTGGGSQAPSGSAPGSGANPGQPKAPLPWLQNRPGNAAALPAPPLAAPAAMATSAPAPTTPSSWPPPALQSPGASVATVYAADAPPPPPLPPAAAQEAAATPDAGAPPPLPAPAVDEAYSLTRDSAAAAAPGAGSNEAPTATGSANSTAGIVTSSAAAEAADSSGRKRRPLDAGLTGDQLRHARKRRMRHTAPAVKDMLKPLYAAKTLDKEAFKLVAAAATAELAETVEVADMTADDVHGAVQRALEPLNLSLPN